MRHITHSYIAGLVAGGPKLLADRRPKPMPGKKWPTRVAWHIRLANSTNAPDGHLIFRNVRTLNYIGKPNRYRALEARNFLAQVQKGNVMVLSMWQAEFDAGGLVAYIVWNMGHDKYQQSTGAFSAYHPHSSQVEVAEAFIKPLHLKYIGGMRLYSQKAKLSAEAVEAYYEWYQKQFKRRLRRPKSVPTMVIAGQPAESMEEPI
jgi:hypothetical protein